MSDETRTRLTFWNLNTAVGAVGLVASGLTAGAVLFGWGGQFNDIHRNFEAYAEWQDTWEQDAKDRRGEIERQFGSIDARDTAQDETIRKANETASQNSYRIAGLEARGERLERSLEDLAKQLNAQSGDIRVIREILTRIEASQNGDKP